MLEIFLKFLVDLNAVGFWNFLTAASAINISIFLVLRYRRRFPGFSVYLTYYCQTGHDLYPNTINIEIRNLLDSPIVVSRPNFTFSRYLKAGNAAHGNTSTGDYEVKFRPVEKNGNVPTGDSFTSIMLRHRNSAFAYVPFDDALSEEELLKKINNNSWLNFITKKNVLGYLSLNLVVLKENKPVVLPMKLPVKHIRRHPNPPPLGTNSHPKLSE